MAVALWACSKTPMPPTELKKAALDCQRDQDDECAEQNLQDYLSQRPNDGEEWARLGIVQNKRDEHEQAIVSFRKAIDLGEGTYDLFAYYADSLTKLGKTDEAIDWSYKSLAVVPTLVDVRGNLAKLLVQKKRYFEALTLLSSFDERLAAKGQQPYFDGQRIAIETAMQQAGAHDAAEQAQLRLTDNLGNFYAPVTLGQARVTAFVVDTGATVTTVSDEFLAQSRVRYEVVNSSMAAITADGRRAKGRLVNIDSLKVGDFEIKDVPAMACPGCQLLLGQVSLSHFDLSSGKVQGVEFLTLKPHER